MFAKKSLGQHFLRSERALNTIIKAGDIQPDDTVLEIGPGKGVLTKRLLEKAGRVVAVEKDDQLFEELKNIHDPKLELLHDDILDFEPPTETYKLIANIPYNITGAIIKKFLSANNQPAKMVLLVQKEVAERIVARKSKPFDSAQGKESILSISVKAYGTPQYAEKVPAGAFVPAPKVDSAIIAIENISKKFFDSFTEKEFFDLLHKGFKSKRKKLSSNLERELPWLDPNIRAEDVSVEEWHKIAEYLLR